jgi:mono/diheme cytochrome c family protein
LRATDRRRSHPVVAAAALVAALVLAGCGTGGIDRSSNTSGGRELFVSNCGSCHTLKDAGTLGKVGPDLDAAFGPSRAQGFKEETIRQIVRDQIHLPSPAEGSPGFPEMPANIVTGDDADAVAAYVASVAGTAGAPTSTTGAPPAATAPSGQTNTGVTGTTPTTTAKPGGGPAPSSAGSATKGKSLYSSLGCSGCHSVTGAASTGPTFKGLYGSKVQLTNGQSVTADVAYLMQSIEDPDAQIVKSYQPGVMSSVIKPHQVAESDARDLVAYIKTIK